MLPTMIQRYDKKLFHFLSSSKKMRDCLKFYRLSDATSYDSIIPCINSLNFSWIKLSIFEVYGAFNITSVTSSYHYGCCGEVTISRGSTV